MFSTYSFSENANVRVSGKYLYASMYSEHPNFNMLTSSVQFLSEARLVGRIDLQKHTTEMIVSGFPSAYHINPYQLFSFAQTRFDIYNDRKMLVGFEGTPELYVCDHEGTPTGFLQYNHLQL